MGFDGSFQNGGTGPIGISNSTILPPVQPFTPILPRYEIVKVKGGRQGALEFPMGPNSSIFLADEENPSRIWMVMTDALSTKTVIAINGTVENEEEKEKLSLEEFDKRLRKVEELLSEQRTNSTRGSKSKSGSASTTDADA